jgi:hypothetical protein
MGQGFPSRADPHHKPPGSPAPELSVSDSPTCSFAFAIHHPSQRAARAMHRADRVAPGMELHALTALRCAVAGTFRANLLLICQEDSGKRRESTTLNRAVSLSSTGNASLRDVGSPDNVPWPARPPAQPAPPVQSGGRKPAARLASIAYLHDCVNAKREAIPGGSRPAERWPCRQRAPGSFFLRFKTGIGRPWRHRARR